MNLPETLRQLIERQMTYVPPEAQRVLEVASVAGWRLWPRQWRLDLGMTYYGGGAL